MAAAEERVSTFSSAIFVAGFVLIGAQFNLLCMVLSRKTVLLLTEILNVALPITKTKKSQLRIEVRNDIVVASFVYDMPE